MSAVDEMWPAHNVGASIMGVWQPGAAFSDMVSATCGWRVEGAGPDGETAAAGAFTAGSDGGSAQFDFAVEDTSAFVAGTIYEVVLTGVLAGGEVVKHVIGVPFK